MWLTRFLEQKKQQQQQKYKQTNKQTKQRAKFHINRRTGLSGLFMYLTMIS